MLKTWQVVQHTLCLCLCRSKRLTEAEATIAALRRTISHSDHHHHHSASASSSMLHANGSSVSFGTEDTFVVEDQYDQYVLGAAKKGLKKLRDQLDQDAPVKGR